MKTIIILLLLIGLTGALFLTRPQRADFEKYARDNKLSEAQTSGGPNLAQTVAGKLRTFSGGTIQLESPTDEFLKKCTFHNYLLWTNVEENGQVIYTGAVGHWFQRSQAVAPTKAA